MLASAGSFRPGRGVFGVWPAERLVELFRRLNGCAEPAQFSVVALQAREQIELERSTGCAGAAIDFYRVGGGGHNAKPAGLDVSRALIDFFSDKPAPAATAVAAQATPSRPDDQAKCQRAGGDSNIFYCQSRWRLAPDEALLVEPRRIPRCDAWNFQLSNFWMESLDYRWHRIHVNQASARPGPDGRIRIVVAHRDPGPRFPNWLKTAGHTHGGMLFRWIGADEHPPIDTRVVPFARLAQLA